MNNFLKIQKKKYKKFKNLIPVSTGKLIEKILFYFLVVIFLIIIPILFTLLSTMIGLNIISLLSYHIVFYTTWSILILLFITWIFFREFKNK